MRRTRRVALAIGVLAAPVVAAVPPVPGQAAHAAEQPTVEVWSSPSGARVDGVFQQQVAADSTVEVRWQGFTPNSQVVISQCVSPIRAENEFGWSKTHWSSVINCAHQTRLFGTTGPDGTGKVGYPVKVGNLAPVVVARNGSAIGSNQLICNGGRLSANVPGTEFACVVAVSECEWDQPIDLFKPSASQPWTLVPLPPKAGVDDPAVAAASGQVRFKNNTDGTPVTTPYPAPPFPDLPTPVDPPPPEPITGTPVGSPIEGVGSVNIANVLNSWLVGVRRLPQPADVDFIRGTSQFGGLQLKAGFQSHFTVGADFAVTGTPYSRADAGGDVVYAPISLTALAVANSAEYGGLGLNDVRLSPRTLAFMLAQGDGSGTPYAWNDPNGTATAVDNHGCQLPPLTTMPILRAGPSAQNHLLSSWFDATLPKDEFPKLFASTPGGQELLPVRAANSQSSENGAQTADNIATNFGKKSNPSTGVFNRQTVGAIGYPDITEVNAELARHVSLPTSPLKNAAGEYVAPTKDSILAAYPTMHHNADGTVTATFDDASKPDAYPLPMVHYLAIPKTDAKGNNPLPIGKRKSLAGLIEYIVGASGQQQVEALGAPALPDDLKQQALAVAAMLKRPDPPKPDAPKGSGHSGGSSSSSGGLGGSGTGGAPAGTGVPVSVPTTTPTPAASASPSAALPTIAPVALRNESTRGGKIPAAAGAVSIVIILILGGVLVASGGSWRGYLIWRRWSGRRTEQP